MKKILKALKLSSILMIVILSFVACDKDFNTLGSDIIGDKNFQTKSVSFSATSYNKKINPIVTNGLPANLLGIYNDPVYGTTTANVVSQLQATSFSVDFGANVVVDSVILSIPYFNKVAEDSPDSAGNTVYSISDSVYGDYPIKLSLYRINYFLRNFNPDTEFDDPQYYYSNDNTTIDFDSHIESLIYENDAFYPTSEEIQLTVFNSETGEFDEGEKLTPRLRAHLDEDYWKTIILDKEDQPEISNANNFTNYFRGVYFKTEAVNPDGHMTLLDLSNTNANITIHYSFDSEIIEGRDVAEYVMLFSGTRLNTFQNNFNFPLIDGDESLGDEKLYIKGGEGSIAIVDLFGNVDNDNNGMSDELEDFKSQKDNWLINEANLIFYEDQSMFSPNEDFHKYDRIYLYDLNNNIPITDYNFDGTVNDSDPVNSRIFHLGQRFVDENGAARFKIRVTEHINRLLQTDSTNTKLGLVLSTNVNLSQNTRIKDSENEILDVIPVGSVLNPKGTILLGSNPSVPADKRVQLEIFYTEPDN